MNILYFNGLLKHMFFNESLVTFKEEDNVYGRF